VVIYSWFPHQKWWCSIASLPEGNQSPSNAGKTIRNNPPSHYHIFMGRLCKPSSNDSNGRLWHWVADILNHIKQKRVHKNTFNGGCGWTKHLSKTWHSLLFYTVLVYQSCKLHSPACNVPSGRLRWGSMWIISGRTMGYPCLWIAYGLFIMENKKLMIWG